ncbi:MAG TPA: hypothetical protein PKD83_04055 [Ignavibacteria bacterium]|nr:hypothetical protein [Ignavibacteria bacterium]
MKTIALVTPKIDTFTNPTLSLFIEKLLEQDYRILFFGYEQMFIPPGIRSKLVFYQLPFHYYKFVGSYNNYLKLTKHYLKLIKRLKIDHKVKNIVCVDPMGMVIAGRIRKLIKAKLIYASFEIFFEEEFKVERKKILRSLEKKYSSKADLLIIQDKKREKMLREINNFSDQLKVIHIPVSPKPADFPLNQYDINKELNIPEDKTIVVYSGTLNKWSGIFELLELVPEKLNSDFWLVIHSHHILRDDDDLKIKISELIKKKHNISFHNIPFYDNISYFNFLASCDIGIATYFPNDTDIFAGKNIQEIGLSSGKFSTYMMLGLPTVTTSNSIYIELNNKYNFGEIINTTIEIPEALNKIMIDYEDKSRKCKLLYEKELNPESRIDKLLEYINNN